MKQGNRIIALLVAVILLFSGCSMTVNDLYCLPKRSEVYANLQVAIDEVMVGLEYSAPVSGTYRQTVQMADLDGDKKQEYILFAKGGSDKPLHIFIFAKEDAHFTLMDHIECSGTDFEQVEYIRLNDKPGFEMVVGCQISDEVLRSVLVYTMVDGHIFQMMSANYHDFACADLNEDGLTELLVLRPGINDGDNGVTEFYYYHNGVIQLSQERMSRPVSKLKRIMLGILGDGIMAAFVTSETKNNGVVTDVYAVVDDAITNITQKNEMGIPIDTSRTSLIYADDIDEDGVMELPKLYHMQPPDSAVDVIDGYLIGWYSMSSDGFTVNKQFTYHNFTGGWYLVLQDMKAEYFSVVRRADSYEFYIWNTHFTAAQLAFTIYVSEPPQQGSNAIGEQFLVKETDTAVYTARFGEAAGELMLTNGDIMDNFRLIP